MAKKLGKLLLCLVMIVLSTFIALYFMHRPSLNVIAQWDQPDSIKYASYSKFNLSVVESDHDWSGFPLYVERNYFIYLGTEKVKPSYGHIIKFSFFPSVDLTDNVPTFIKKSQVQWTNEGAMFIIASGHHLFIPKEMFIGER
jgi:hypothetical protein